MTHRRTTLLLALYAVSAATLLGACGARAPIVHYDDPFDGPSRGFVLYLDFQHLTAVAARESRRQHKLEVMFVSRGQRDTVVPSGTPVELMVGNQRILWVTSSDAEPVTNVFGSTVITQWKLLIDLSPDQVAHLAGAPLSAVRAEIGGEPYMLQLSADQSTIVLQNMSTLLSDPA